jgi:hypothetical protein
MKDCPDNITWMIEVRDWPDGEEPVPTPERPNVPEWMKWAPEKVTSYGTGVMIKLEQLNEDGTAKPKPEIKNYLLTCGHVVRVEEDGFGPVAKEIVCWHPDYGYIRTRHRKPELNHGRLKRQMEGGHLAHVSKHSPYDGRPDAILDGQRERHLDWVLLEVEDLEGRDSVNSDAAVSSVKRPNAGTLTKVVGYPSGAGWARMASQWKAGAYMLIDGKSPQAKRSGEHSIANVANGILTYNEAVDARPGMSGGGVFTAQDQTLVGLHRSRDDAALDAQAICVADILEWLRFQRHMRPIFPEQVTDAPVRPEDGNQTGGVVKITWPAWLKWAASVVGALCLALLLKEWIHNNPDYPPPVPVVEYVWRGVVQEIVIEDGQPVRRAVDGVLVMPHLNNDDAEALKVLTPSPASLGPGEFRITTTDEPYHTDEPELHMSKTGYKFLARKAQAVIPAANDQHRRIYTIKKLATP